MKIDVDKLLIVFLRSFVTNIKILTVWYIAEYIQFGELQVNRWGDSIVWAIYVIVITILLYKKESVDK